MSEEDDAPSDGPRVSRCKVEHVGSCNFCGTRTQYVTTVESKRGFQVRFCDKCLRAVEKDAKR